MSDSDLMMVALAVVAVVALFAICVAVKKSWDADFYKMMWEDSNRQNDRLFDRVKELQDSMAKKVTGIGNGFVSVKGKMLRVAESDKFSVPTDKKQLSVYTKTGNDIRITHVDQILTHNQLDKTLDKVRNNFFGKMGFIW